jgi:hypothetical protein
VDASRRDRTSTVRRARRELGEPFDFLTWFEWSEEHSSLFDELLGALRATEEWTYVEREVEVRLEWNEAAAAR